MHTSLLPPWNWSFSLPFLYWYYNRDITHKIYKVETEENVSKIHMLNCRFMHLSSTSITPCSILKYRTSCLVLYDQCRLCNFTSSLTFIMCTRFLILQCCKFCSVAGCPAFVPQSTVDTTLIVGVVIGSFVAGVIIGAIISAIITYRCTSRWVYSLCIDIGESF